MPSNDDFPLGKNSTCTSPSVTHLPSPSTLQPQIVSGTGDTVLSLQDTLPLGPGAGDTQGLGTGDLERSSDVEQVCSVRACLF